MSAEWWTTADISDSPGQLGELLVGAQFFLVGDGDQDTRETIERVEAIGVGFDAHGMFAFVRVVCRDARPFVLYNDGTIHDMDDREVGRHDFVLLTSGGRRALVRS